jgi:pimeloyl-ACP methyl ester carboxylesterase
MQDWWQATFPKGRQTVKIIDANGNLVSIAYGEKGTGKPLFLVHGVGSWSYNWRNSVEPLSKYFRVICFDAKGYGFSEKPLYREKHDHQVIELERIISALCDEPAIVVAESLGALVSLGVVLAYPKLIERLVVVNVPIFPERLPHWGMWLLSQLPLDVVQAIDNVRLTYWFAPLVREMMRIERQTVLYDPSILTDENVYWISYPFVEFSGTIAKVAEDLQIAAWEIEQAQENKPNIIGKIQNHLGKIKCPTLILWGEQDGWYPPGDGERLRSLIPNSQLKILPNCGHDASAGASPAVNAAIVEFLQDTGLIERADVF